MKDKLQKGQALITLLIFVVISISITSAAVMIIIINSISSTRYQEGVISYYIAESGLENASLRMLRDPNYAGETLAVGGGTAVVVVTGSNPKIATSTGTIGNFKRKVQVKMNYNGGYYTFSEWREVQ